MYCHLIITCGVTWFTNLEESIRLKHQKTIQQLLNLNKNHIDFYGDASFDIFFKYLKFILIKFFKIYINKRIFKN